MKIQTHNIGFVGQLGIILLMLLMLYIGSYVVLSVGGRYEPAGIGLNGVKWYSWAPRGFVTDFRWRSAPMGVYLPLLILDDWFWHTHEKASSGQYPVNEVKREDIWKVYKANGVLSNED